MTKCAILRTAVNKDRRLAGVQTQLVEQSQREGAEEKQEGLGDFSFHIFFSPSQSLWALSLIWAYSQLQVAALLHFTPSVPPPSPLLFSLPLTVSIPKPGGASED